MRHHHNPPIQMPQTHLQLDLGGSKKCFLLYYYQVLSHSRHLANPSYPTKSCTSFSNATFKREGRNRHKKAKTIAMHVKNVYYKWFPLGIQSFLGKGSSSIKKWNTPLRNNNSQYYQQYVGYLTHYVRPLISLQKDYYAFTPKHSLTLSIVVYFAPVPLYISRKSSQYIINASNTVWASASFFVCRAITQSDSTYELFSLYMQIFPLLGLHTLGISTAVPCKVYCSPFCIRFTSVMRFPRILVV